MHESPRQSWVASIRAVTLAAIVAASVVAGGVAFTGSVSAAGASASDVGTGLRSTTQTVTYTGQVQSSGEVDYFTISMSDITNNGATITDASFADKGQDGDQLKRGTSVNYNASTSKAELWVAEGSNDSDKKITFEVTFSLDTTGTTPQRQAAHSVRQYDTKGTEKGPTTQDGQFQLYGGIDVVANTSSSTADAAPVNHSMRFRMTGTMDVRTVVVNTPGANYGSVSVNDITQFKLSGQEAAGKISSVSGSGDQLTISFSSDIVIENADWVDLVIANAGNPSSSSTVSVLFKNDEMDDRFRVEDGIAISGGSGGSGGSGDDSSSGSGGSSTTTTTTQSSTGGGGGGSGDDSSSGGGGGDGGSASTGGSGGGGSGGGGGSASTGGSGGGGSGGGADTGGSSDDDDSSSASSSETTTSTTTISTTDTTTTDSTDDSDDSDSFNINDADTFTTTTTTKADSPGFTSLIAVIAIGAAILLVRRRP